MSGRKVVTGTALFVSALAAIFIAAVFVQLYIKTHDPLICRQRIAMSPNATQENRVKLESLRQSFCAKLPKMAFALIAALASIISFTAFYVFTVTNYLPVMRRLTGSRNKNN